LDCNLALERTGGNVHPDGHLPMLRVFTHGCLLPRVMDQASARL
jgi:hypothetical protein